MLEEVGVEMQKRTTRCARTALLLALAGSLAVVAAPAAGSTSATILWQGRTPDDGTAYVAAVSREFRVELEAIGSVGSTVTIGVSPMPAGATLTPTSDAPAQAIFRWTPRIDQLRDWKLTFSARDGATTARTSIRIHVGRTAARTFRLSNVNGRSQSAELLAPVQARARPSLDSRVVMRLRALTPEQVPHILYLAAGRIDAQGRYWLRVPLPRLPNGSFGWIPREAVGSFSEVDTHLVIERSKFRITLYKQGRRVFRAIIGIGQPRWPTPAGSFYIRERLTGFTDPIYGSLAFGTNGRSAVLTDWPGGGFIGIHGTNQPGILPGRVSHGCVRLRNPDIRRLDRLMRLGTPVTIR